MVEEDAITQETMAKYGLTPEQVAEIRIHNPGQVSETTAKVYLSGKFLAGGGYQSPQPGVTGGFVSAQVLTPEAQAAGRTQAEFAASQAARLEAVGREEVIVRTERGPGGELIYRPTSFAEQEIFRREALAPASVQGLPAPAGFMATRGQAVRAREFGLELKEGETYGALEGGDAGVRNYILTGDVSQLPEGGFSTREGARVFTYAAPVQRGGGTIFGLSGRPVLLTEASRSRLEALGVPPAQLPPLGSVVELPGSFLKGREERVLEFLKAPGMAGKPRGARGVGPSFGLVGESGAFREGVTVSARQDLTGPESLIFAPYERTVLFGRFPVTEIAERELGPILDLPEIRTPAVDAFGISIPSIGRREVFRFAGATTEGLVRAGAETARPIFEPVGARVPAHPEAFATTVSFFAVGEGLRSISAARQYITRPEVGLAVQEPIFIAREIKGVKGTLIRTPEGVVVRARAVLGTERVPLRTPPKPVGELTREGIPAVLERQRVLATPKGRLLEQTLEVGRARVKPLAVFPSPTEARAGLIKRELSERLARPSPVTLAPERIEPVLFKAPVTLRRLAIEQEAFGTQTLGQLEGRLGARAAALKQFERVGAPLRYTVGVEGGRPFAAVELQRGVIPARGGLGGFPPVRRTPVMEFTPMGQIRVGTVKPARAGMKGVAERFELRFLTKPVSEVKFVSLGREKPPTGFPIRRKVAPFKTIVEREVPGPSGQVMRVKEVHVGPELPRARPLFKQVGREYPVIEDEFYFAPRPVFPGYREEPVSLREQARGRVTPAPVIRTMVIEPARGVTERGRGILVVKPVVQPIERITPISTAIFRPPSVSEFQRVRGVAAVRITERPVITEAQRVTQIEAITITPTVTGVGEPGAPGGPRGRRLIPPVFTLPGIPGGGEGFLARFGRSQVKRGPSKRYVPSVLGQLSKRTIKRAPRGVLTGLEIRPRVRAPSRLKARWLKRGRRR